MSKEHDFYWGENIARTLKDIHECVKKNIFSCQYKPLLDVKLENVVLDELHLMLRITGEESYLSHKYKQTKSIGSVRSCPTMSNVNVIYTNYYNKNLYSAIICKKCCKLLL